MLSFHPRHVERKLPRHVERELSADRQSKTSLHRLILQLTELVIHRFFTFVQNDEFN